MYQFLLRVRIDLQITALCSPGHNYPTTTLPYFSSFRFFYFFYVKLQNIVHRQIHGLPVKRLNIQL